ncbi:histone H1-like [Lathyrus oleraceus]|uniref:histone H1-like n=1 Tax=Pisum sativum TaxID=3888 RepID=UPI0021CF3EA9|nr:histone H1-like [Pisum sativum]
MVAIPTTSNQYTFTSYLNQLPANFKKLLLQNLKKDVASGKLVKVKASFKLSAAARKPAVAKPKTKPAAKAKTVKAKTAAKPKSAAIKPKLKSMRYEESSKKTNRPKLAQKESISKNQIPFKEKVPVIKRNQSIGNVKTVTSGKAKTGDILDSGSNATNQNLSGTSPFQAAMVQLS